MSSQVSEGRTALLELDLPPAAHHLRSAALEVADIVQSLEAAWKAAGDADEVCVIGGTSIFAAALPLADVIHLTEVQADVEGDTYFPEFDRGEWRETQVAQHDADERHAYPLRIVRLDRKTKAV